MRSPLFLGIDGGASKTQGALLDDTGRVIAECRMPGSALSSKPSPSSLPLKKGEIQRGWPAACAVLRATLDELLSQAGAARNDVAFCALGLNGVDFPSEHAMQRAEIASALAVPPEKLSLVNDGIVALWGATGAPAAALIQCGSGFTAAWRREHGGEELFDHLNVGRIVDPRTELLRLVARMIDGRAAVSPLKDAVLQHLGLAESDYAEAVYRNTVSQARRLGTMPLFCQAWQANDAGVLAIAGKWADDLAVTAKAMLARIGSPKAAIALGGGVINAVPDGLWMCLKQRVRQVCGAAVTVQRPLLPPMLGAAISAACRAGHSPQQFFDSAAQQYSRCSDDRSQPVSRSNLGKSPILVFENAGELGRYLAGEILQRIAAVARAGHSFLLGCPGGRSLRSTYQALGTLTARTKADLSHLVVVMMDDYVVSDGAGYAYCPAGSHFSCRRFAEEEIRAVLNSGLAPSLQLKPENVWFPAPSRPSSYDERIAAAGGIGLFLLASGATDGHVAFNPPGTPADSATRIVALAESTRRDNLETFPQFTSLAEVPAHGVTVGLGTIARHSHEVALVLHGSGKAPAFQRLRQCDEFIAQWPASIVFRCKKASILVDRAAAGNGEIRT